MNMFSLNCMSVHAHPRVAINFIVIRTEQEQPCNEQVTVDLTHTVSF